MNNPQVNPKKLFIGSLAFSVTQEKLKELFSPHGEIVDLKLIIDRYTGQSKGIAFVEYATQEQAEVAIKSMNDTSIDDRKIVVNVAKPQVPRDNSSFGHNRNRY